MPPEKVRLRIRNLAKAVLVSGQAYQDPKDALNEFVSNAADEYAEAYRTGERIRVVLRRKGRYPAIIVDDVGRGMSRDRLREVAQSLFESSKAGDSKTLGEKAIGMLAFQQLGQRCDLVSRTADSSETWTLRLERGKATAILEQERRRMRQVPGTSVYLSDLDPDVLRVLTQRKVVDYLRSRRGPGLARGDYEIEVIEGSSSEIVLPERPDGVRLTIPSRNTLWGRVEFAIYVAPSDGKRRRVAVVGRAGTSVVDDLTELDEFDCAPWNSDQVSGQVIFESLQQSAGRRAILRDREAFPLFVEAVKAIEPAVSRTVERVSKDVDAQTADRLSDQSAAYSDESSRNSRIWTIQCSPLGARFRVRVASLTATLPLQTVGMASVRASHLRALMMCFSRQMVPSQESATSKGQDQTLEAPVVSRPSCPTRTRRMRAAGSMTTRASSSSTKHTLTI